MKLSAILVALLSTLAYSERVDPHSITLNDTAELLLVRKTPTGWEPAQKIFDEEIIHGGNGSATWKLRGVSHKKGPYALWLDGKFYPYDPKATSSTGYAALTPWFKIQDNTPYLPAGAIAGVVVGVLDLDAPTAQKWTEVKQLVVLGHLHTGSNRRDAKRPRGDMGQYIAIGDKIATAVQPMRSLVPMYEAQGLAAVHLNHDCFASTFVPAQLAFGGHLALGLWEANAETQILE
ncbi:hypothetical protein B0A50_05465 [Salinomyces thailandicus]|uniref:Uncharacterized protein n=1 Tax=Salinomyces thailandicus TaxID=706561 RepID=A0A4U0TTT5_9PEZI|nr:hypothetical protein B0A50_05465 [Salinomyces thailandica]